MKLGTAHLIRIFVAGALAALPLAATVFIFWWVGSTLVRWLGPDSTIGGLLVRLGLGVTGSEFVGYLFGAGIVVLAIFGLGLAVETGLQRGASALFGAVLQRIPVVSTVYDFIRRMVDLLARRDDNGVRSMAPVWCHFGGPGGSAALGLLSSPQPVMIGGQRCLGVLIPTAPVPVGGGLLYVPEAWVTPAELGVEALTSIYVSMGVTSAQHLPPAPAAPAAAALAAAASGVQDAPGPGAQPPARSEARNDA